MQLYQYRICPFCNKTKSALEYLRVPFTSVEVNPLTKSEIKGLVKNYNKVPIAKLNDGTTMGDSYKIIEKGLEISPRFSEQGFKEHFLSDSAKKWHEWSDTKFAVYLYPNITRSYAESYNTLEYVHTAFPAYYAWPIRIVGAFGMSMAHPKIKKKYNIDNERKALSKATEEWEKVVGDKFAGGEKPDLGDISVYGSVRGLDFLPLYQEFMVRPLFKSWLQRMDKHVSN